MKARWLSVLMFALFIALPGSAQDTAHFVDQVRVLKELKTQILTLSQKDDLSEVEQEQLSALKADLAYRQTALGITPNAEPTLMAGTKGKSPCGVEQGYDQKCPGMKYHRHHGKRGKHYRKHHKGNWGGCGKAMKGCDKAGTPCGIAGCQCGCKGDPKACTCKAKMGCKGKCPSMKGKCTRDKSECTAVMMECKKDKKCCGIAGCQCGCKGDPKACTCKAKMGCKGKCPSMKGKCTRNK